MSDVIFVRELADGRDLVYAFSLDGRPAWALDQETGLQWWYDDTDLGDVRRSITEQRETFATMPVSARSHSGSVPPRHPAVELSRRSGGLQLLERPPAPQRVLPPARGPGFGSARPSLRSPAGMLFAVLATALAVGTILVLLGFGSGTALPPTGGSLVAPDAVRVADDLCEVRGDIAHDAAGGVLVCAPTTRAMPEDLVWRSAG